MDNMRIILDCRQVFDQLDRHHGANKLGLEYQFSAKDFKPHEQSPMVL